VNYALTPILIVLASNVLYNLSTKEAPATINPFAMLSLTYLIAAVISALLYCMQKDASLVRELAKLNWTSFTLALSIVGLEVGYLLVYRSGWPISLASLVANIALALVLLVIGWCFFHEVLTMTHLAGILLCLAGLTLIVRF